MGPWLPKLSLNKFQERPSGASGIQENLLAAGVRSRIPLWELAALPQTLRRPRLGIFDVQTDRRMTVIEERTTDIKCIMLHAPA